MKFVTVAIVIALGALSGFAGSVLAQRTRPPAPAASAPISTAVAPNAGERRPFHMSQQSEPESCAAPQAVRERGAANSGDALPSAPGGISSEDLEREEANERQQQQDRLLAHAQEPRDPGWAREMEATLRTAFDQLSRSGLHYSEVECRYTSCKARVEWPDPQTAYREAKSVAMMREHPLPCARFLVMDPPVAGRNERAASIYIDCQQARLDTNDGAKL